MTLPFVDSGRRRQRAARAFAMNSLVLPVWWVYAADVQVVCLVLALHVPTTVACGPTGPFDAEILEY
jgi:hypothetical protein